MNESVYLFLKKIFLPASGAECVASLQSPNKLVNEEEASNLTKNDNHNKRMCAKNRVQLSR
jgi:hypothetical protein